MRFDQPIQCVGIGRIAGGGECVALRVIGRHVVRLSIVTILESVLEVAQEDIRGRQLGNGRTRQQPARAQRGERVQRPARAQAGFPASAHQLQRLHDELDLADAAWPQLDVARVILATTLLADLSMHVAQAGISIVVEILAEHERGDEALELLGAIAGQRPRLQPRVALPGSPLSHQIFLQRRKRRRQRAAVAVRPQAHVDAKHKAFGGNVAECCDDTPPEAVEKFLVGQRFRSGRRAVLGVGEHEVDIRGGVELGAAQFAHRDDDESLRLAAIRAERLAVRPDEQLVMHADCGLDRELGQTRLRCTDLRQIGAAGEIPQQCGEPDARAQRAQSRR